MCDLHGQASELSAGGLRSYAVLLRVCQPRRYLSYLSRSSQESRVGAKSVLLNVLFHLRRERMSTSILAPVLYEVLECFSRDLALIVAGYASEPRLTRRMLPDIPRKWGASLPTCSAVHAGLQRLCCVIAGSLLVFHSVTGSLIRVLTCVGTVNHAVFCDDVLFVHNTNGQDPGASIDAVNIELDCVVRTVYRAPIGSVLHGLSCDQANKRLLFSHTSTKDVKTVSCAVAALGRDSCFSLGVERVYGFFTRSAFVPSDIRSTFRMASIFAKSAKVQTS